MRVFNLPECGVPGLNIEAGGSGLKKAGGGVLNPIANKM
jgi:hypothetical protein